MKNEEPMEPEIPEVNPEVNERAVRIYGQGDAMEEFPVLKAFQQYVDAEQSKARRRMLILCIFFGILMAVVIAVFMFLLMRVGSQNQKLNDRLIEYAMQEREREAEKKVTPPVVVQPQQDSAAILALTSKIDDLQKKLAADQAKAEKDAKDAQERADKAIAEAKARADKAAADAAAAEKARLEAVRKAEEAARAAKGPSDEEREILRLKALLEEHRKKESARIEAEKERQRQEELEAYRRKHYPEFYKPKPTTKASDGDDDLEDLVDDDRLPAAEKRSKSPSAKRDILDEIDEILNDAKPVTYFDEDVSQPLPKSATSPSRRKAAPVQPVKKPSEKKVEPQVRQPVKEQAESPSNDDFKIPVEIKGTRLTWQIPED